MMPFVFNRAAASSLVIAGVMSAVLSSSNLLAEPPVIDAPKAERSVNKRGDFKQKLEDSRALLKAGREDAVEANLAKDAQSQPQSLDWHQEMAANLLRVAFSAQEAGDTATAKKAARRALAHYVKVETLANGDAAILANVAELRGVIAERILGSTEDAVREYRKSLKLKDDSPSVREKMRQVKPVANKE